MTREKVLGQLAIRMSHLFDGDDAILSGQLEEMRRAVRKGADESALGQINERLSKQILLQEDKSRKPEVSLKELGAAFSTQLRALATEASNRANLEALAEEIETSQRLGQQLSALKQALESLRPAVAGGAKKYGGGLRGLFDKKSAAEDGQYRALVEVAVGTAEAALDHVDVLSGSGKETKRIRGLLEKGGQGNIENVLSDTAELLKKHSERLAQERESTQNFLGDLREKLLDVEQAILSMLDDGSESLDRASALEQGVSEDVRTIGAAIDSDDINHLKQTVEGGLTQLTKRVAEYIETEKENYEKTQDKVAKLNSKLLKMEDEARDLRGQIKDKQDLAIKDPLTGVYNRFGFDERIGEEFARHERMHSPLSLVFVDCNKFKQINDTFGHKAGDTVLLKVAETLSNRARTSDVVARYGGDEFVVILPDTPIEGAQRFAEDASRIIQEAGFNNNGRPLDVSISCGVTQVRDSETPETALERADGAMYKAKQTDGVRVVSVQ